MELVDLDSPQSIAICEPSPPRSAIGRVMGVLLASRSRHLDAAIRRLGVAPARSASGSLLDESLCFLWRHVQGAVEKGDGLDEVVIPMIEHSLLFKEPKYSRQVAALLGWLFRDENFADAILTHLVELIKENKDHFVAFGWCKLVTMMVEVLFNVNCDNGKRRWDTTRLKILLQSIPGLSHIICKGSIQIDGFELPTRLAAASADCMLALFEALMRFSTCSSSTSGKMIDDLSQDLPQNRTRNSECSLKHGNSCNPIQSVSHHSLNKEIGYLLWNNLNQLMLVIEKLIVWSKKSQSLHAIGLEQLLRWMQDTKLYYGSLREEAGNPEYEMLNDGILLLCSCWKHIGRLLRLNDVGYLLDHNDVLEQLLGALQFYSNQEDAHCAEINGRVETRKFILNCITLLLGRLHGKYLHAAINKHAHDLLPLLFAQLENNDEDLAEAAVGILRATLLAKDLSTGNLLLDAFQMEHLLSLLLKHLNSQDPAAGAVVQLTAECCHLCPTEQSFEKIFELFAEGKIFQKRNVAKVISAIICSGNPLPLFARKKVSKILIECLEEGLLSQDVNIPKLFSQLDATVLPKLLHFVCSKEENIKSSATGALIAMLQYDTNNFSMFFLAIDYISNCSETSLSENLHTSFSHTASPSLHFKGLKLDIDQVLRLLLKSSEKIGDPVLLIDKLIDRMFADPSNAVIVRLMSLFSDMLAENVDLVFQRVLIYMRNEKLDDNWLSGKQDSTSDGSLPITNGSLFSHLCPLLLLRVLPLRVYDNLSSSDLYDHMMDPDVQKALYNFGNNCIAAILVGRAFDSKEHEDVRKVATELCGRLHPQILLPVVVNYLDDSVKKQNTMGIKGCLFALCTSLMVRGMSFTFKMYTSQIRDLIDVVLSWPSLVSDEVSKAQHGCIDCLALLICAELGPSESANLNDSKESGTTNATSDSIIESVIQRILCDDISAFSSLSRIFCFPGMGTSSEIQNGTATGPPYMLPFRLCMANVLISAYQKVSNPSRSLLGNRTLPLLIAGIEKVTTSEVRAACLQIFFSAVYNLKAIVHPFAFEMFKLGVEGLKNGTEKEKIAASKLLVSLMASDDEILSTISGGLPEAISVLSHVSSTALSAELQKLCRQLMSCMISPLNS